VNDWPAPTREEEAALHKLEQEQLRKIFRRSKLCNKCAARIVLAETANGKWLPFDLATVHAHRGEFYFAAENAGGGLCVTPKASRHTCDLNDPELLASHGKRISEQTHRIKDAP
jgi:hypothetical protein